MSKIENFVSSSAGEINVFMNSLEIADMKLGVDTTKGKKLRGALVMLVSEMLDGDKQKALEFAAAIELIHLGSLTHDDVIDEHEERRGTIPLAVLKGAKWAVLSGDMMFTVANKLASKSGNKEAIEVADAMQTVLSGAIKEISMKEFLTDIVSGQASGKFYYKMIGLKTAGLFKSAGRFGAMASTSNQRMIDLMGEFGHYVGTAYQIADDLTDIIKMSEGTKEPDIGSVISIVPAVFNYNRDMASKVPFMLMAGRISIEKILEMITSIDMSSKMKDDIKEYLLQADNLIEGFEIQNEFTELSKEYPKYCIDQILAEVDEKI